VTSQVTPEVFALVKLTGAHVVGKAFRLLGEVYVCKKGKDGMAFMLPYEIEELNPEVEADLPAGTIKVMTALYDRISEIARSDRVVPMTREEAKDCGVCKKSLKSLEGLGLISLVVIPIVDYGLEDKGKHVGARSVVLFTSQGRAFIRKHIDPQCGVEGGDDWERAKQWLAERRRFEESK